jgi:hypothetical protein
MNSYLGGKQIHFLRQKFGDGGMAEYELPSTIQRGNYDVTLKIVNVHRNQVPMEISVDEHSCSICSSHGSDDFEFVVSSTETQELEIPYTMGSWQTTTKETVRVELYPGATLRLSRKSPNWGLTIKEIILTPA